MTSLTISTQELLRNLYRGDELNVMNGILGEYELGPNGVEFTWDDENSTFNLSLPLVDKIIDNTSYIQISKKMGRINEKLSEYKVPRRSKVLTGLKDGLKNVYNVLFKAGGTATAVAAYFILKYASEVDSPVVRATGALTAALSGICWLSTLLYDRACIRDADPSVKEARLKKDIYNFLKEEGVDRDLYLGLTQSYLCETSK
jgi:hypothetical protein